MCQRQNFEARIKLIGNTYSVKKRRKSAIPKRMRCSVSKRRFENLYIIVLITKRKLIKKGRNHPFAKFDKVSKKKEKIKAFDWD